MQPYEHVSLVVFEDQKPGNMFYETECLLLLSSKLISYQKDPWHHNNCLLPVFGLILSNSLSFKFSVLTVSSGSVISGSAMSGSAISSIPL